MTATQHHIARNNGFHRQMCGLMMKMQCVGRTYQTTIARAILWSWMVRLRDGFHPSKRFCHTCLPWVRRNTKVLFLGSLPSSTLDHLASWAAICRPIYPRTRLNRRNEPDRSTSVETVRTKRNETISVWRDRWMALGDRPHALRNSYSIEYLIVKKTNIRLERCV